MSTNSKQTMAEWGGKIYFNHGSNHSKGVAILFDPRITVIVKKEIKSDDGRIIILETDIDDEKLVPNNIQEQQIFFKKLLEMLRNFANSSIVMGGDFNCRLSNEDKKGGQDLSSKKTL
jgi:exonuclease III